MEATLPEIRQRLLAYRDHLAKLEYPFFAYHVWNYAFEPFWAYYCRFGQGHKKNLFVGINPGPVGMMQNGIPFGTISLMKTWLKLDKAPIKLPNEQHPKRPIRGWLETRNEESGARLWGLARRVFQSPENFFAENFVLNYCPVGFIDQAGKNVTPDALPAELREQLEAICNEMFRFWLELLQPKEILGIGRYTVKKLEELHLRVRYLSHPSPLNPAARGFWIDNDGEEAYRTLRTWGIWA